MVANSGLTGSSKDVHGVDPDCDDQEFTARDGIVQGRVVRLEEAVITIQKALKIEEDGMLGPIGSGEIATQWGDVTDPAVLAQLPEDVQAAIGVVVDKIGPGMFKQHAPLETECALDHGGVSGLGLDGIVLPEAEVRTSADPNDDGPTIADGITIERTDDLPTRASPDEGDVGGQDPELSGSSDAAYVADLEKRVMDALAADDAAREAEAAREAALVEPTHVDKVLGSQPGLAEVQGAVHDGMLPGVSSIADAGPQAHGYDEIPGVHGPLADGFDVSEFEGFKGFCMPDNVGEIQLLPFTVDRFDFGRSPEFEASPYIFAERAPADLHMLPYEFEDRGPAIAMPVPGELIPCDGDEPNALALNMTGDGFPPHLAAAFSGPDARVSGDASFVSDMGQAGFSFGDMIAQLASAIGIQVEAPAAQTQFNNSFTV